MLTPAGYVTGTGEQSMEMATEESLKAPPQQWVSFVLGDERYAVDVMRVKEVLKLVEITPVAGAPNFILGVINLRGSVVTVIDARCRFGLPQYEPDDASRIILVDKGLDVVGILVDRVGQVLNISPDDVETTPLQGNGERRTQGVVTIDGEVIVVADLDRLVPNEGQQMSHEA